MAVPMMRRFTLSIVAGAEPATTYVQAVIAQPDSVSPTVALSTDNDDRGNRRLQTHDEFRSQGSRRNGERSRGRGRMLARPAEQTRDDGSQCGKQSGDGDSRKVADIQVGGVGQELADIQL